MLYSMIQPAEANYLTRLPCWWPFTVHCDEPEIAKHGESSSWWEREVTANTSWLTESPNGSCKDTGKVQSKCDYSVLVSWQDTTQTAIRKKTIAMHCKCKERWGWNKKDHWCPADRDKCKVNWDQPDPDSGDYILMIIGADRRW